MFKSQSRNVQISATKCSNLSHEMFKSQLRNVQISAAKCSNLDANIQDMNERNKLFPTFFLQRHETDGVANGGRAACISETTVQHIICER